MKGKREGEVVRVHFTRGHAARIMADGSGASQDGGQDLGANGNGGNLAGGGEDPPAPDNNEGTLQGQEEDASVAANTVIVSPGQVVGHMMQEVTNQLSQAVEASDLVELPRQLACLTQVKASCDAGSPVRASLLWPLRKLNFTEFNTLVNVMRANVQCSAPPGQSPERTSACVFLFDLDLQIEADCAVALARRDHIAIAELQIAKAELEELLLMLDGNAVNPDAKFLTLTTKYQGWPDYLLQLVPQLGGAVLAGNGGGSSCPTLPCPQAPMGTQTVTGTGGGLQVGPLPALLGPFPGTSTQQGTAGVRVRTGTPGGLVSGGTPGHVTARPGLQATGVP